MSKLREAAEAVWDAVLIAWGEDTTRKEIIYAAEQALAPFIDDEPDLTYPNNPDIPLSVAERRNHIVDTDTIARAVIDKHKEKS